MKHPDMLPPSDVIAEYDEKSETLDTAFNGAVRILQPKHGYRFSVDALLVGWFAPACPSGNLLDVGAGCGVIGLCMLHTGKAKSVVSIEVQPELAALIERNAALNDCKDRLDVYCMDIRDFACSDAVMDIGLIVCNPPFFKLGCGRDNPNVQISRARREHNGTLDELMAAMRKLMQSNARLVVVYGADRLADLLAVLKSHGLVAQRLLKVHGRPGMAARQVLVEAAIGKDSGLVIEQTLFLENEDGSISAVAQEIYSGKWSQA
jgi:tRNA1Val (adenine37-N6)-methyltransferase